MTTKKVFSATDAHPTVLHAKRNADSEIAYPVLVDSLGNLSVTTGLVPTGWDFVDLSPPALPTTITFKTGGSGGTTIATLSLTYSGSDLATVTRT